MHFETPITVKDVGFLSYVLPHEEEPFGILQMTFRLPHMQNDVFLIEIRKDESNRLYSKYITYLEEDWHEDMFGPMFDFSEEEHLEVFKAVVNDPFTQEKLADYKFGAIQDVYVFHEQYDEDCEGYYEVILHHTDLSERTGPHNEPASLEIEVYSFREKEEAFSFYQHMFKEYTDKSFDFKSHSFGAIKFYWENAENKKEVLTYARFIYKGEEIMSEEEYLSLDHGALHETALKDVELDSYFPKQEKVEETLYFSFRTSDMSGDEYIMSVLKDEQGNLYSEALLFFDAEEKETYNVSDEFEETVLLAFLTDLLQFPVAQEELKKIGWNPESDCYIALR